MIIKALLAFAGLRAAPSASVNLAAALHSDAVHDTLNAKAAILGGHARMMRLQKAADQAAAKGDDAAVERIRCKQSDVRVALDDLARRLG